MVKPLAALLACLVVPFAALYVLVRIAHWRVGRRDPIDALIGSPRWCKDGGGFMNRFDQQKGDRAAHRRWQETLRAQRRARTPAKVTRPDSRRFLKVVGQVKKKGPLTRPQAPRAPGGAQHMAIIPKATTNDSLVTDLHASLRARCGVAAGMTWASFKAAMAQLGVTDDDFLGSIEYGVMQGGSGYIVRDDEHGLVEIREVSHARR